MIRRWLPVLAAALLAGCVCKGETVTRTAYASMASYATELTGCIVHRTCLPLCVAVFQLGTDIERCELIAFDGAASSAPPGPGSSPGELQQLRGATVRVTYVEQGQCDDSDPWWDFGGWDDGSGDVSGDDGSSDDGSVNDGSGDGSDDGSAGDGSDDGSGDGSGDDGSGDDGSGGDATGTGPSARPTPAHVHAPAGGAGSAPSARHPGR